MFNLLQKKSHFILMWMSLACLVSSAVIMASLFFQPPQPVISSAPKRREPNKKLILKLNKAHRQTAQLILFVKKLNRVFPKRGQLLRLTMSKKKITLQGQVYAIKNIRLLASTFTHSAVTAFAKKQDHWTFTLTTRMA